MRDPNPVDIKSVSSLDAMLSANERAFRKTLLDSIVKAGRPVTPAELVEETALSPQQVGELINSLMAKKLLVKDGAGEIGFVYPVSARPNRHQVTLADGRIFYAMCAIDALGCAFEFDQDVAVTSTCSYCQTPLSVHLAAGKLSHALPATIQVIHVDLDQYTDWAANC